MIWLTTMFHQAIASISVIVVILGIGIYGRHQGRGLTDAAVAETTSSHDRTMIEEQGYIEASRPLQFAGIVAGVLGVLVIIGEIRRRNQRA
ncbi:MAG TPA: hypothetical protein VGO00_30275 [Kofleriaceae bacterium]|jgi:hypothetical protein|nr:hypothetical protein [Kofleriaceae bacterium]